MTKLFRDQPRWCRAQQKKTRWIWKFNFASKRNSFLSVRAEVFLFIKAKPKWMERLWEGWKVTVFFFFFLFSVPSDNKGYDDAQSHGEWIGISHAKKRQIRWVDFYFEKWKDFNGICRKMTERASERKSFQMPEAKFYSLSQLPTIFLLPSSSSRLLLACGKWKIVNALEWAEKSESWIYFLALITRDFEDFPSRRI